MLFRNGYFYRYARRVEGRPPLLTGRPEHRLSSLVLYIVLASAPNHQVVGALAVPGRFQVHPNAQVPRSALPHIRPRASLIERRNVAREFIAFGA